MEDLYTREKSPDLEDFYFVQQVCRALQQYSWFKCFCLFFCFCSSSLMKFPVTKSNIKAGMYTCTLNISLQRCMEKEKPKVRKKKCLTPEVVAPLVRNAVKVDSPS